MRRILPLFRRGLTGLIAVTAVLALTALPAAADIPGTTTVNLFRLSGGVFYGTVNSVGWRLQDIELVWGYWYTPDLATTAPVDESHDTFTCVTNTYCERDISAVVPPYCGLWALKAFAIGSKDGWSNETQEALDVTSSNGGCGECVGSDAACSTASLVSGSLGQPPGGRLANIDP